MARTSNKQPRVIGAGIAAFKASLAALKGKRTNRGTGATARRNFLAGAVAIPAAALGADSIETAATKLTSSMTARHGGRWATIVNHEAEFILIVRKGGEA